MALVSVGDGTLGRRAFWVHRVKPTGGYGPTLDIVVSPVGAGTRWLAALPPRSRVEVTGPLGRPFALPKEPARCVLVGEAYAAAPLFPLAERLRERGCPTTLVIGAADEAHLLNALEARRSAGIVTVVTADGSVGERGDLADFAAKFVGEADVVYAAGSVPLLGRVARAAETRSVEPARAGAAAHLRHRAVPGLSRPGRRRRRLRPHRPRVRRRAGLPWRPGPLGGSCDHTRGSRPRLPVMVAAGCGGTGRELAPYLSLADLGAFVTRSITVTPDPATPAAGSWRRRAA